jgi:hypothetical protein
MFNLKSLKMKKPVEISAHLILWILFALMVLVNSKLYLEAKPDAPFSEHLSYVVFLEILIGAIFFYSTYIGLTWAARKSANSLVLVCVLFLLLVIFAVPAFKFGIWQILSSMVPHIVLILIALLFRNLFGYAKNNA